MNVNNRRSRFSEDSVKLMIAGATLFFVLLLAFFALQLSKLNNHYSFSEFFPKNHSLLLQSKKVSQIFQLQEKSYFAFIIKKNKGTWLASPEMSRLQKATEKIKIEPLVQNVLSLSSLEGAIATKGELHVGRIFESMPSSQWPSYVRGNTLIESQLISEDLRSAIFLVEPTVNTQESLKQLRKAVLKILQTDFESEVIEVAGGPEIQTRFTYLLSKELKIFVLLSFIAFLTLFAALIRGWSSLTLAFGSLIAANVIVLGALALLQLPFTVLLSTLPIILSVSIISVMIHTLHRWAEVIKKEKIISMNLFQSSLPGQQVLPKGPEENNKLSVRVALALQVLREMFLANLLGSVTTSLGFLALLTAQAPLIQQYAGVVAVAVFVGFLISQLLLLIYMPLTTPRLRTWSEQKSYWTLAIFKHRELILLIVFVVIFTSLFFVRTLNFSTRLFDDLAKNDPARVSTEKLDAQFGGSLSYELVLVAEKPQFWKNIENLKKLETVLEKIRHEKEVGSVLSLSNLFSIPWPKTSQALAETLFLFSMSEADPVRSYLTEDGQQIRLALRFHDVPSRRIFEAQSHMKIWLKQQFPAITFQEGGLGFLSHHINAEVSKELVFGFWQSLLLIGALLFFVFKSLRWALVACLPNLIPPLVLMGTMGASGTPIKPGVAIIFSIALGLAFNNTVYLLSRLKKEIEKNRSESKTEKLSPASLLAMLKRTMLQEGNPCLFETLIMFSGFVIFLASGFGANKIFGVYMIISIVAGALGDLLFLPALLSRFPGLLGFVDGKVQNKSKKTEIAKAQQPDRGVLFPLHGLVDEKPLPLIPVAKAHSVAEMKKRSDTAKIASGFVFAFLLMTSEKSLAMDAKTKAVLEKIQGQIQSKDEQALLKMSIIEANGETKVRSLRLQTLQNKKFYSLVRIQAPADIKGTALLSEIDKSEENQWLYLPSTKQVRRVVNTKKSNGVLGSELSMDDLNSTAIKGSEVRMYQSDATYINLEVVPHKGKSVYDRIVTTVLAAQSIPVKTEYFRAAQLVKTVQFSNYKKVGNIMRAHSVKIRNLKNRRGTDLELSEVQINKGLKASDFTVNALKE